MELQEHIIFKRFKSEIEKAGLSINRIDEDGFLFIEKDDLDYKIHLENSIRDYESNESFHTVDTVIKSLTEPEPEIPNWTESQNYIYSSLVPNDSFDNADILNQEFDSDLSKIFVYYKTDLIHWITNHQLENWGIDKSLIFEQANSNINRVLNKTELEVQNLEGHKLCFFDTDFFMKSELLLSTDLKAKMKKEIGWPIYCVFPVRDFIYMFGKNDFDYFSNRIGSIVIEEYENTQYPITTGIYEIGDNGFELKGKY